MPLIAASISFWSATSSTYSARTRSIDVAEQLELPERIGGAGLRHHLLHRAERDAGGKGGGRHQADLDRDPRHQLRTLS